VAVDEATSALLADMAENGLPPLHEQTPAQARAFGRVRLEMYGPGPEVGSLSEHAVPVDGGTIAVRAYAPAGAARALIVYYHGGGWVLGALDEFDTLARQMADRTGAAVLLVDYRLAPEHRYPVAAQDAWAALRWADARLDHLAGARVPLIVAGDSAGGNLSAIVAQRAKAEHGPEISLQVLVYPVTDADLDRACYTDPANQLMLTREGMIWFWDHYAPDLAHRRNADASPLRAADLSGLPPAVVLIAEHDVLREEGEAYADRLRAAGVAVRQRCFAGQMHGFFTLVNMLPGAAAGLEYVAAEIDRHLAAT
jgi:acetyl esterase